MQIVTCVYGDIDKWRPLLEKWVKSVRTFEPDADIRVGAYEPKWVAPLEELDVSADLFPGVPRFETVHPLNTCGLLKAHLALYHTPCWYMDMDATLRRPLPSGPWELYGLGMARDPRTILWSFNERPRFDQVIDRQAGVMWFGTPEPGERYLKLYPNRIQDPRARKHGYWDQIIMSEVYADMGTRACELPPHMNWSHRWGSDDPRIVIYHEHGKKKWESQ